MSNGRDDGADRHTREGKPCCFRMPGGWHCVLPDGHPETQPHEAPPPREIPTNPFVKGKK